MLTYIKQLNMYYSVLRTRTHGGTGTGTDGPSDARPDSSDARPPPLRRQTSRKDDTYNKFINAVKRHNYHLGRIIDNSRYYKIMYSIFLNEQKVLDLLELEKDYTRRQRYNEDSFNMKFDLVVHLLQMFPSNDDIIFEQLLNALEKYKSENDKWFLDNIETITTDIVNVLNEKNKIKFGTPKTST